MRGPNIYGFVCVNVPVPYFKIKSAIGIGANPCFVMDCSALAAKIGERHKVTGFTLLTFWKFHWRQSFLNNH